MVVYVLFIYVRCNNILKASFQQFISKLYSDLMSSRCIGFTRSKGLYQMERKVAVFLIIILSDFFKLTTSGLWSTSEPSTQHFFICLAWIFNIFDSSV